MAESARYTAPWRPSEWRPGQRRPFNPNYAPPPQEEATTGQPVGTLPTNFFGGIFAPGPVPGVGGIGADPDPNLYPHSANPVNPSGLPPIVGHVPGHGGAMPNLPAPQMPLPFPQTPFPNVPMPGMPYPGQGPGLVPPSTFLPPLYDDRFGY